MNVIATDIIFSAANKRKLDKNDIMEKYRKKKKTIRNFIYYGFTQKRIGKGVNGTVYYVSLNKKNTLDSHSVYSFSQEPEKSKKFFVKKKILDVNNWRYELINLFKVFENNKSILNTYFCKFLQAYEEKIQINPIVTPFGDNSVHQNTQTNHYIECEYISSKDWSLIHNFFNHLTNNYFKNTDHFNSKYDVANVLCLKLINMLLDFHFNCSGATYYDLNTYNVFINILDFIQKNKVTLKMIDYGGLFCKSLADNNNDIYLETLINEYFLPDPELYDLNNDIYNCDIIELYKIQKMIPAFYSIVTCINMCMGLCDEKTILEVMKLNNNMIKLISCDDDDDDDTDDNNLSNCSSNNSNSSGSSSSIIIISSSSNNSSSISSSSSSRINNKSNMSNLEFEVYALKLTTGFTMIASILKAMNKEYSLNEQKKLFTDCNYQKEFLNYLWTNKNNPSVWGSLILNGPKVKWL